jgi:uncharacterized membrane-anchored protein
MDLIMLVLVLAIIGFLVWLITSKIPMDPMFKIAIQVIVLIVVILWLIRRFGGLPNLL